MSFASPVWEKVSFKAVNQTDQIILTDQRQIELIGLTAVDLNFPEHSERCLTENIKLSLHEWLNEPGLKVKFVNERQGYLRIGTQDLGEALIARGWAKTLDVEHSAAKTYKALESSAQRQHLGRWGQCDQYLPVIKWQKARGRTPWFWDRYHSSIRGSTVGKVTQVRSGNMFELANGLRVRLSGVGMPESNNQTSQCFNDVAKDYLESQILGEQVLLESDDLDLVSYKTIARQVYLPQTSWRPATWLNLEMIEAGMGKLESTEETDPKLIQAQENIWQSPVGAWVKCLNKLTIEEVVETEVTVAPELIYDEACRIKGNISGSKKNPKKTYHTPLSGWYKRIAYEACFETETEAEAEGFKLVK